MRLFTNWLEAQDEEGYDGTFEDYVSFVAREPTELPRGISISDDQTMDETPEEVRGARRLARLPGPNPSYRAIPKV